MEHTRFPRRLRSEVAAARSAIIAGYWRLWHSEPPSWEETASRERQREAPSGPDLAGEVPDEDRSPVEA